MCMENQSVLPRGIKPAGGIGELQATKWWPSNNAGSVLPRGIKPAGGTVWGTPPQVMDWGIAGIVQVGNHRSRGNPSTADLQQLETGNCRTGGGTGGNVAGSTGA